MLYLRGQTDNKILQGKNIHIWDGNTSREFLDKRGLYDYEEGDMGETYGFNFRHFGGDYQGCHIKYEKGENGFDQLENVIHLIKNDPESRNRIVQHINLAVLEGIHRSRVNIQVRVKLLNGYLQSTVFEERPQRSGCESLTQRTHHTTSDKNIFRFRHSII